MVCTRSLLCGSRRQVALRCLVVRAEAGQARGQACSGGAEQQQSGNELPRHELAGARSGDVGGQADAGHRRFDLDEDAGGELCPREPDDDGENVDERRQGDRLLEGGQGRDGVGERPADEVDERGGYSDQQS
ncbi:hypothetical protein [Streptomyces tubercidicus]|uniref:hypothetical protein n=1 Tax=Streptomyces tubercidicus TaxID=47759 RepID=UPI002E0EE020